MVGVVWNRSHTSPIRTMANTAPITQALTQMTKLSSLLSLFCLQNKWQPIADSPFFRIQLKFTKYLPTVTRSQLLQIDDNVFYSVQCWITTKIQCCLCQRLNAIIFLHILHARRNVQCYIGFCPRFSLRQRRHHSIHYKYFRNYQNKIIQWLHAKKFDFHWKYAKVDYHYL